MKLFRMQVMILLSKKDLYILLGSLLLFLSYVLYASGYYLNYNYQLVYRTQLFHEYLIEMVSIMKFTIVLFGIFITLLSRKLHCLDGLLLSRANRMKIITSRIIVLVTYLFTFVSIVFFMFLTVGYFLTPIMESYGFVELFLHIQLFGLYYLLMSYLFMMMLRVVYAPLYVLFFYFLGTIWSPYYAKIEEVTLIEKIVNYFVNDLILFHDFSIKALFGSIHVIILSMVLLGIIIYQYNKNDIIIM